MVDRVHKLNDPDTTAEFAKELGTVEASLSVKTQGDRALVKEISAERAELCVEAGFQRTEYDNCQAFMDQQCSPDVKEIVVPAAVCIRFFAEEKAGAAPAAAVAGSPFAAPGPAPGPQMAEILEDKVDRPLQEQGVSGPLVKHADMDTHTSDWQQEFGPNSGAKSFEAICADHPGNEWCRLHGYYDEKERAGALRISVCGGAFAVAMLSLMIQ